MLKRLRTVLVVAMLTVATYAAAAEMRGDHPDTYVVKRGDTLWDIAGRFLQRPWLWPEIWQANPQVKNPHLIYPGDVLSLAYLNRVTVSEPGSRAEAPIGAIPLSQIEPFLKNLRVVDEFKHLPYVVGLEDDRLRSVSGQLAYVRGLGAAQTGERYAVLRPTLRFFQSKRRTCCYPSYHEDLDYRGRSIANFEASWRSAAKGGKGELLGYELAQITTGTVTRGEVDGIEASTLLLDLHGHEVRVGDRIVPVDAQPYDLQFFPHPPANQQPEGKLQIVAVADMLTSGGPRDVVAISGGSREGIDNGTVFSIWRNGSNVVDRVAVSPERTSTGGQRVQLPAEYAGHVMVFRTFDKVSYGLVMEAVKPARVGYALKHPDATH